MSIPPVALHVFLDAPPPTARLRYTMDVLCAWFAWTWSPLGSVAHASGPRRFSAILRYREEPPLGPLPKGSLDVRASKIFTEPPGATSFDPVWAEVYGQHCPCALDALGGIFYCLSLYAEYGIEDRDAHGRIPAAAHPFVARGIGRKPIADALALALATQLWRAGGLLGRPSFAVERIGVSVDIDAPTALAGRPWVKRQYKLLHGVIHAGHTQDSPLPLTFGQIARWSAGTPDPFDTYAYIDEAAVARSLPQDYFTLVGYGTKLDPGWRRGHPRWAPFWRKLNAYARLGIHPSYHSSEKPELIRAEIRTLSEATDAPVEISRQHFLRLRLPETFRVLVAEGIREEHSLMWADALGFRTGSSRSFPWYDLLAETATDLIIVPPHAMDVTARYYGGLSPKQAVEDWTELAEAAHAHGSGLRCIWHNSNLGPWYGWHPWREAFEASLDLAAPRRTTQTP